MHMVARPASANRARTQQLAGPAEQEQGGRIGLALLKEVLKTPAPVPRFLQIKVAAARP